MRITGIRITDTEATQIRELAKENNTTMESYMKNKIFGYPMKPKKSSRFKDHKKMFIALSEGKTFKEVAEMFGISRQAVSAVVMNYRDKLGYKHLSPKDFITIHFNKVLETWK